MSGHPHVGVTGAFLGLPSFPTASPTGDAQPSDEALGGLEDG